MVVETGLDLHIFKSDASCNVFEVTFFFDGWFSFIVLGSVLIGFSTHSVVCRRHILIKQEHHVQQ